MNSEDKLNAKYHPIMFETLTKCAELLKTKGEDYGHMNMLEGGCIASIITGKNISASDVAACIIGIKLSRYGNLLMTGAQPNHEPVKDNIRDVINYFVLMERERAKDAEREANRKT